MMVHHHFPELKARHTDQVVHRRLETGQFSDCAIVCGDQTWKTHKVILCRVKYFEKAVRYSERHARNGSAVCTFSPDNVDPFLGHTLRGREKKDRTSS